MTRISFIMPSFNRADYIAESIESVLAQMHRDDELVIVDDGSTDDTESAVAPYLGRLRYVRQDNAGKSVALNRALAMTSGKYVWICDDDDLLLPGAVEALVDAIASSGADMAFGRYTRFRTEEGRRIDMGTGYWPDLSSGSIARHILEDAFAMHNGSLVRRATYDRLGPFDPAMLRSQDYEMFARIALSSSIVYVDRDIFLQRKHGGDRGPAAIAHKAGRSDAVWDTFDRRIFAKLRDLVPEAYFTSMFDGSDEALERRAGLLQRACILARHGFWDAALADCERAAALAEATPLHPLEIAICRRMSAGKHGFAGMLTDGNAAALRNLGRKNRTGAAIAAEIRRGLVWRLRSEVPGERIAAMRILARPTAILSLLRRRASLASPSAPTASVEILSETAPDTATTRDAVDEWRAAIDREENSPR
jgi:hypothetical protein